MKKVKVKVSDDPKGHRHVDREVVPGEIIEVWPRQAAFLQKLGVAGPIDEPKSRRSRKSKDEEPEADETDESTTEGASETPAE